MKRLIWLAMPILLCASASADTLFQVPGFEAPDYNGSAGGTLLTGQQGWINPVAGSSDFKVYTYAGNTLGIAPHPAGGAAQFAAGRSAGSSAYGRAQHTNNWAADDVWTVTYDILTKYDGTLPATDNIGSFSLQPSATAKYWQSIFQFEDPNTATAWKSGYFVQEFPNTGPAGIPGPAWRNLAFNHWYRESVNFRFSDRLILSISITDLNTMQTTTVNPGWHLVNQAGFPDSFRFFTGGTTAGNITAWDIPEPGTFLMALGLAALATRRSR
jgi:hypothetical protein